MEMVDITIQIETERLTALNFFLFDKQNSSLKTECFRKKNMQKPPVYATNGKTADVSCFFLKKLV